MHLLLLFSLLFSGVIVAYAADAACLSNAATAPGFCAKKWVSGLSQPRAILVLSNNDVLVVERGKNQITLFYEDQKVNSVALATANSLNHGIAFGGGYLYASSPTTVYRWPYTVGSRTPLGNPETVITGIPSAGHNTRTLVYDDSTSSLIVSVGSNENIDTNTQRSGLYRFSISSLPTTYNSKVVLASGLRNEVGVRFDPTGRLWGVENGVDNLNRPDLGGDIHNENPGEEMNLFDQGDGKFYGYPYCWSMYNLSTVSSPRLSQYAWQEFINDGTHSDAWCQNTNNVVKPKYAMRAHTAPLDILFYNGGNNFPSTVGNAFVALHGSWNRDLPAGYAVIQVAFKNGMPESESNLLSYAGPGETGKGWIRPAGLGWYNGGNRNTTLLVTDDTEGNIIAVSYDPNCGCNQSPSTTTAPATSAATTLALSFMPLTIIYFFWAFL